MRNGVDSVAIVKGNEIDGWLDSAIVWESQSSVVYRPHPSKDKQNFIAVGLYLGTDLSFEFQPLE